MIAAGASSIAPTGLAAPATVARRGESFALSLVNASGESLRGAAEQLVASSLIQPILTQLRESLFAAGPFAPGMAEKQFSPLLDQHLADRIVRGANLPLVDVIVDRLGAAE